MGLRGAKDLLDGLIENADTQKGTGYCQPVEIAQYAARFKKYVILVLDAADEEYYGFKPRLWTDVCVELRVMAAELCKRGEHLRAAMNLAFTAGVEQNLLKLRPPERGSADEVVAALTLPPITDHVTRFLALSNMARKTASNAFLSECEPYFLDAVHTIRTLYMCIATFRLNFWVWTVSSYSGLRFPARGRRSGDALE